MKEPFIKILKEKTRGKDEGQGTLLGLGVIQGLSVGLPQIVGYSCTFEDTLISHDWKRKIGRDQALTNLTDAEAKRSLAEQVQALKDYLEETENPVIQVSILVEVDENKDGTLNETEEYYHMKHLAHDSETGEFFIVVS